MKKLFFVLAALMMVPALYAADDTPIQNVCDSLSLHGHAEIDLVPAYIEESNWYGNPDTWVKDSSNVVRHETYETVKVKIKSFSEYALPISVHAACRAMEGTTYKYATWNNSKEWVEREDDDFATFIHDIKEFTVDGRDQSNTYNILTFVHGSFPADDEPYKSHQLLFSTTFEFAFEWWYVGLSYEFVYDTIIDGKTYAATRSNYFNAVGNDSLETFNSAKKKFNYPEGLKTVRVQSLKVVLVDSRKVPEPESSSSVVVSSSSEVKSSSSNTPATSSSAEQSSSSGTPTSSADDESSSSAKPETSSSTGPALSSSSNVPESSSTQESSSSDKPATSSSGTPATSSSGTQGTSSSGAEPESSSSEKPARLVTAPTLDGSARMVQVRTLDGSIVNNSGKLAPGVYYVKYSNGKWSKMAVLPR
jgi:hypothetical protein